MMLKLADLTFYCNKEFTEPSALIAVQYESLGYVFCLKGRLHVNVIKHTSFERTEILNNVQFSFFKGNNRFGYFSLRTARHLRSYRPDVIVLQGLMFPLQVLWLRFLLGKKPLILTQHHGEHPFQGVKSRLQQLADSFINGYIFTSLGNAGTWLDRGIISKPDKCYEILEASTKFEKQDKECSKLKTGMTGEWNFLWVGRLNLNKDPLTVLNAFEKYVSVNPFAKLFMIYHTEELLTEIKDFIGKNKLLNNAVFLKGKVNHEDLQHWYSAADFFLSGSHREGSGFALIEAMSCGCIPVITDIFTFRKISVDGRFAFLYEPGNSEQLFLTLKGLDDCNRTVMSDSIIKYFTSELSFESIADKLYELCKKIKGF